MAKKITIKKVDKVGLKLLPDERQMLLDLPVLDKVLEERLKQTPASEAQVKFTLDELDLLGNELAAYVSHAKDRRLGKKLDGICLRIERIEDMFEVE